MSINTPSNKANKAFLKRERNAKLAGVENKGKERIEIRFADGTAVETNQKSWYFMHKIYARCCKLYGDDIRKWPEELWKEGKAT